VTDKLLGLNPADFGTTKLTLKTLIGIAYVEPERVLPRGHVYGRGGGQETMQAWRTRAVCCLLELHGVDLNQPLTTGQGDEPAAEYLVWSHDAGIWWKPGGAGYTDHITRAGRFTLAEAQARALHQRSWPASQPVPPEVVVLAPSAELLASPDLQQVMVDRISAATAQAITARVGRQP
jgi:hypothetical protein